MDPQPHPLTSFCLSLTLGIIEWINLKFIRTSFLQFQITFQYKILFLISYNFTFQENLNFFFNVWILSGTYCWCIRCWFLLMQILLEACFRTEKLGLLIIFTQTILELFLFEQQEFTPPPPRHNTHLISITDVQNLLSSNLLNYCCFFQSINKLTYCKF